MPVSSKKKIDFDLPENEWLEWKKIAGGSLSGFIKKTVRKEVRKKLRSLRPTTEETYKTEPIRVRFTVNKKLASSYANALDKSGLTERDFWLEKLTADEAYKKEENESLILGVINQLNFIKANNKLPLGVDLLIDDAIKDLNSVE